MVAFYRRNKYELNKLFFITGFLLASYIFVVYIFRLVAPFCFAFLFSLAMEPLVRFLNEKMKIKRSLAALLCIVIALLLIFVIGANLVSKIWEQIQAFVSSLPRYIAEFDRSFYQLRVDLSNYFQFIPLETALNLDALGTDLVSAVTNFVGSGVKDKSISVVSSIPYFIINTILFLISSFFFIKDKVLISGLLSKNCPPVILHYYLALKKGLFHAIGGYIKAQCIVMSIVAILSILGLVIIGYPYALLMGLLIAVIDALPLIGGGFILWPWAIINIITGDYPMAIALFILYGAIFLTRQFLEPKILSAQIGLYPIVTLISIYAGLKIFGVLGFFIGPIIVLSMKVLMNMKNVNS